MSDPELKTAVHPQALIGTTDCRPESFLRDGVEDDLSRVDECP